MLKVIEGRGGLGARLVATRSIPQGAPFFRIRGHRIVARPTYQTVQIARSRHAIRLDVLGYINHSCQPNVIIDTTGMVCYAVRDIAEGEDLNYFYPSTEWEMARPFLCLCGAANCIRIVAGARQLSVDVLSRYFINDHIRTLIASELGAAARSWAARLHAAAGARPRSPRRAAARPRVRR